MKRMWLLVVLLVATVFQSNAQTTIPFYGFELSNYEVGDTLQYNYSGWFTAGSTIHVQRKWLWQVLEKNPIGSDTIEYVMHYVHWKHSTDNFTWSETIEGVDTANYFISNDTVYYNTNNLLNELLLPWDTLYDSTSYLLFDTVSGLKHLEFHVDGWNFFDYEATENLGVVSYLISWEDFAMGNDSYSLTYANLQNYGIYGEHDPIVLSTESYLENALVEYDYVQQRLLLKDVERLDALYLYDVSGRCLLNLKADMVFVPLSYFPPGVYFYRVIGKQTATGKVLVR